jgi:pyruvate dehydrogenase E1 component alpha subunit
LTYFGDGAARQGSLHEAFNMAMLWKLPVVLSSKTTVMRWNICRKNGEPFRYLEVGLGYEMPCGPVDGMNSKVAEAMTETIERASW